MSKKKVVIALGHRALGTTMPEQYKATRNTAKAIADLVEAGTQIYIQATEPAEKNNNDLWINPTNYDLKQYDSDNLTWALKGNIKGETGETGATGVGIQNVTVNSSNHLIVKLTNETEIDAGDINVTSGAVIDTTMSASSENPVQNKVIYEALADKQDA